jgi:DNA invertase Pin-like site-specific DNA recombinase
MEPVGMDKIIYARWSSLEQGRGSSLERQLHVCREYCSSKGWTDVRILKDEGRSAYTGANLTHGELGEFTKQLEQGIIPYGSTLIVEQLDRLSRRPAQEVLEWIFRVVRSGLTIITVNDRLEINQAELERNQFGIMMIVVNSYRAYSESKFKSERVGDAWRIKREKLGRGEEIKKSAQCPGWLELDRAANRFVEIPERVALVRRIFDLTDAGVGKERVAAMLNDEGIPTWGKGKRAGTKWHPSYVQKITRSPTVLGEYQPHVKGRADAKRVPVGEPIQNYYPPIIDAVLFARVNRRRRASQGRKGEIVNLFSGLVRCGVCGGGGVYINKANSGAMKRDRNGEPNYVVANDESYLVCSNRKQTNACTNRHHIRYRKLRDGVLDAVLHRALDDSFFSQPEDVGKIESAIATKRRERDAMRQRAERFLDAMGDQDDPDLKPRWQRARDAARAIDTTIGELEEQLIDARGAVSPAEHLSRVSNVRAAIDDEDPATRTEARSRVMDAIAQVVTLIQLQGDRTVRVILLGGAHAIEFDDQGNVLREAGVLKQIAEGDEQMLRGVTEFQTGHPDDAISNARNRENIARVVRRIQSDD